MSKVIAVANQKGGVGKTTTTMNLGIGLARTGKKVLMIDADSQGDLTICLGYRNPDELDYTLSNILGCLIEDESFNPLKGIIHHVEGVDFIPSNIDLSGIESSLNSADILGREGILRDYLEMIKESYDYILIDCSPSIGMVTINAMVAANSVLIPVEAEYLPAKGLEQLIRTINKIQKKINRTLKIEGVLMTMVDERTNLCKGIVDFINESYENHIKVFKSRIPRSVRAAEISAVGQSLFEYDPEGKAALAYSSLVEEVLANA